MRHLLYLLLLCSVCVLVSCAEGPGVRYTDVQGNTYNISTGRAMMARRTNVVAEVSIPQGPHVRYMAKEENAEKVPMSFIRTLGTTLASYFFSMFNADVQKNSDSLHTSEVLGAQGVQKNKDNLSAAGAAYGAAVKKAPPETIKLGTATPPGGAL